MHFPSVFVVIYFETQNDNQRINATRSYIERHLTMITFTIIQDNSFVDDN